MVEEGFAETGDYKEVMNFFIIIDGLLSGLSRVAHNQGAPPAQRRRFNLCGAQKVR